MKGSAADGVKIGFLERLYGRSYGRKNRPEIMLLEAFMIWKWPDYWPDGWPEDCGHPEGG
jgi:hypothetical protein